MVHQNIQYLEDLKAFLLDLEDVVFINQPKGHAFTGTIGSHTRHIIEFYKQLVKAEENGNIDYDSRERNTAIESDKAMALHNIDSIISYFQSSTFDFSLIYTVTTNHTVYSSSLGRELTYLAEHTVHHLALIRLIAEADGYEFNKTEKFGIAESTQRFRQSQNY
ncbi:MAG: hypothetical protein V4613_03490 [Bacteroidota bacterium]